MLSMLQWLARIVLILLAQTNSVGTNNGACFSSTMPLSSEPDGGLDVKAY